jgi:hypothetical protein
LSDPGRRYPKLRISGSPKSHPRCLSAFSVCRDHAEDVQCLLNASRNTRPSAFGSGSPARAANVGAISAGDTCAAKRPLRCRFRAGTAAPGGRMNTSCRAPPLPSRPEVPGSSTVSAPGNRFLPACRAASSRRVLPPSVRDTRRKTGSSASARRTAHPRRCARRWHGGRAPSTLPEAVRRPRHRRTGRKLRGPAAPNTWPRSFSTGSETMKSLTSFTGSAASGRAVTNESALSSNQVTTPPRPASGMVLRGFRPMTATRVPGRLAPSSSASVGTTMCVPLLPDGAGRP